MKWFAIDQAVGNAMVAADLVRDEILQGEVDQIFVSYRDQESGEWTAIYGGSLIPGDALDYMAHQDELRLWLQDERMSFLASHEYEEFDDD